MKLAHVTALPLLVACSSSNDDGPIALKDYRHARAVAFCQSLSDCDVDGPVDDYLERHFVAASFATCVSYHEIIAQDVVHDVAQAELGRVRYDPDIARRCVTAMRDNCADFELEVCDEVFDGLVALGAECSASSQCAGDAWCERGPSCGVCVPRVPIGSVCASGGCTSLDGPSACIHGTCVALTSVLVGVDAPCAVADLPEGEPRPLCAPGLSCHELSSPSRCAKDEPMGERCLFDDRCAGDGICVLDSEDLGTCETLHIESRVGAVCNGSHRCNTFALLACVDGQCAPVAPEVDEPEPIEPCD